MRLRLLLVSSIFGLSASLTFGQQQKLTTHFMYDKMTINPGSTGMNNGICATSIYRNQWDKINGAPNSAILNVEANMDRFIPWGGGLGISFYHDAIGYTRQNNLLLNYSYHYYITDWGKLGGGIGIGFQNVGMNPDWVPPTNNPDASLPVAFSAMNLDLNGGIYFKADAGYYVGISSSHLSESVIMDDSQVVPGVLNPITYNQARHYNLMGGYKYNLNTTMPGVVEGNLLLRTDLVKFSADINARYIWDSKVYGGLTYRVSDAVAFMAGADIMKLLEGTNQIPDQFLLGYSYDLSLNKFSSISRGSHEILLKYCYYLPPVPVTKTKHPRWL